MRYTCMPTYSETLDLAQCLRKEIEYYAKAAAATEPDLKSAYEAAAQEYHFRAALLKERKTA